MEKVKLTKEQAKAIEWALNCSLFYKDNPDTLLSIKADGTKFKDDLKPLNSISLSKLAKALYVGYEYEKTPEEKLLDYYNGLFPNQESSINDYKASTVRKVLEILGIEIEGVTHDHQNI